jgi:hypothetical protein
MEILSKVSVSIIDPWMPYVSKNALTSSLWEQIRWQALASQTYLKFSGRLILWGPIKLSQEYLVKNLFERGDFPFSPTFNIAI